MPGVRSHVCDMNCIKYVCVCMCAVCQLMFLLKNTCYASPLGEVFVWVWDYHDALMTTTEQNQNKENKCTLDFITNDCTGGEGSFSLLLFSFRT